MNQERYCNFTWERETGSTDTVAVSFLVLEGSTCGCWLHVGKYILPQRLMDNLPIMVLAMDFVTHLIP